MKALMYHSIGENIDTETGAKLYAVSLNDFKNQLSFISTLSEKPIITFDDGFEDTCTMALPLLKEYGLKAYFFIVVSKIGECGYIQWEQLKELTQAGMIIGSHGMTHRCLIELDDKALDYELKTSKKILENATGQTIAYFSLPKGYYNALVLRKIKEAGYTKVFTSELSENDGFRCGRIAVRNDWDIAYFQKILETGAPIQYKAEDTIKSISKKLLGPRNYERLRKLLLR